MPKDLYLIKWINNETGKFGFSKKPQPLKDCEAQCRRMDLVCATMTRTKVTPENPLGLKYQYKGTHLPIHLDAL